jgi:hypothetical protein
MGKTTMKISANLRGNMKPLLIAAAAFTVLAMPAVSSLAAEGIPGATVRADSSMAPADRKARFEQWCKDNPEKCREMKAKAEQRREQCKAEPEKCRAEAQARREQWCKDNPEKCREMKAKAEQRREQCKADPEKCRAEMQARGRERFKKADANGDGRLSREEAQKGMPQLARDFDRIDANKDGLVTMEELEAARKARAGASKGKGV